VQPRSVLRPSGWLPIKYSLSRAKVRIMGKVVGPIWNSLAYHDRPESYLKTSGCGSKYHSPKYLGRGAKACEKLAKAVLIVKVRVSSPADKEEKAIMIDLDQVKVTPRDQQVLNLLVQGCSNKEIAGQLNISPRTVKQHLRTLFLRAGIREGRKRVKLAIAMFAKEEAQS